MADLQTESDTPVHPLLSPEGVRLDLPVAGPAPRILAYAIDYLLLDVTVLAALILLMLTLPIGASIDRWLRAVLHEAARTAGSHGHPNRAAIGRAQGILLAIYLLAQFTIETGYFIFWELTTNGQSPGKMAVGLRVLRRDGLPIDWRGSAVRNVMRLVDMLPVNYAVGLIAIIVSQSGARLGDHVAGTIVVRLDRPEPALQIEDYSEAMQLSLTRDQLMRLGPRELQLIRLTLRRVANLPPDRRSALVADVVETLCSRLDADEVAPSDRVAFLHGLLQAAERYSRIRSDTRAES